MSFRRLMVRVCGLAMLVATVHAGEDEIQNELAKALPTLKIHAIEKSEIEGLFRVDSNNGQPLFVTADGKHFVSGEMYSTLGGKLVNLTEERRNQKRIAEVAKIKADEKIVFPAKGETKASITVFTDIDCGYCRKLHREVPKMNEYGIEVSYLAFPRAGVGSESYNKIVSAFCSEDPLQALTDAKAGKSIPDKTCDNPVAFQYELGQGLGVTGTPAILLEDGTLVPGYIPADKLAQGLGLL